MSHSEIIWEGSREEMEEMRGMMPPDTRPYTQEEVSEILKGDNWKEKSLADVVKSFQRGSALDEAKKIINGDRQDQYGNPEDNFALIAKYWELYTGRPVSRVDVAIMQAQLKIARIQTGVGTRDSFVDALGYIALAADMVEK